MSLRELDQNGNVIATNAWDKLSDLRDAYQAAKAQIADDITAAQNASTLEDFRVVVLHQLNREDKMLDALREIVRGVMKANE